MLNLNLGSGTNRKQDYISVDLYTPEADEHWDIAQTWPYEDESVDNIYACHVIEHLTRYEWEVTRKEIQRVLKDGGSIEIRVPDIEKVCTQLLAEPNELINHQRLFGLQTNPGEFHKNGFTEVLLRYSFAMTGEVLPPSSDYELHMRFTKNV